LWGVRIALNAHQPVLTTIVVKLLVPQHPGETLTHDVLGIRREVLRNDGCVELVGFFPTQRERFVEAGKSVLAFEVGVGESQADNYGLASTDRQLVMSCSFRARVLRIDRLRSAMHRLLIKALLHIGSVVLHSKQPPDVGLVLCKQQLWRALTTKPAYACLRMSTPHYLLGGRSCH